MRFISSTILISFVASIASFFLPWWSLAIAAFLVALVFRLKAMAAFVSGFLGILIYWLPMILFRDINNHHLLSGRMALVVLKQPNSALFIVLCTVMGCLLGGLASLSGSLFVKPAK
jgi:hypothetical protein